MSGRDERIGHFHINWIYAGGFDFNEYFIVGLDFGDGESEELVVFWGAVFCDAEGAHAGWELGGHFGGYSLH